jgi:hypothetical protein
MRSSKAYLLGHSMSDEIPKVIAVCPECGNPLDGFHENHAEDCPLRQMIEGIARITAEFRSSKMDMGYYVLDDQNNPVHIHDTLTWGMWFEANRERRIVKQENIGPYRVSTVFLGLDHAFNRVFTQEQTPNPYPILFETMVFSAVGKTPDNLSVQERCGTWKQAEKMHKRIADEFRKAIAG